MPASYSESETEVEQARAVLKALEHALSHDVEGSLRGIKSLAKILLQKYGTQLNDEAAGLVKLLDEEAERVSRLLTGLMDWSSCGQQSFSWSWQDTAQIAREAFTNIPATGSGPQVEFNVMALPQVWSDRLMLRRVFRELLSNAVKFSGKQPSPVISISAEEKDHETVISVRDNGTGFDAAHTSQLFGLFRRMHRKQEFAGEGAGLAIVKRIVQRHHGRIWAEAQAGQGAVFHFTLPKPPAEMTGS
jgi:light-regulated signal transduction histidine kinase (bacteriophytochrome)